MNEKCFIPVGYPVWPVYKTMNTLANDSRPLDRAIIPSHYKMSWLYPNPKRNFIFIQFHREIKGVVGFLVAESYVSY